MNILIKLIKNNLLIITASLISVFFYVAFALDLTPYLRGPNDPLFESHWPYYFVNTFTKIWAPIITGILLILLYIIFYRFKSINKKHEILFLILLVACAFLFQIALVYFSRFGINILFRRIVNEGINGYFTAAISINDLYYYFSNYPELMVTKLFQHARGDPPGPTLLMYAVIKFFELFPGISDTIIKFFNFSPNDSKEYWLNLTNAQRVAALFLGFFMHFLSAITVVPFYYLLKKLTSIKSAFLGSVIWSLVPSVVFFSLIFDPFFAIFPLLSCIFLIKAYESKNYKYYFMSGLIFSIGLFFTPSILPLLFFQFLMLFIVNNVVKIKLVINYLLGLLIPPFVLLFFGYNSLLSGIALLSTQTPRSYIHWLFYNPYDVFVFMGIPISIIAIFAFKNIILSRKYYIAKVVSIAYLITLILLIISGANRGEAGRIWVPMMIIPVGIASFYLAEIKKYKIWIIAAILMLLVIQNIVLEVFWVPIW